ncbi:MAG: glycoside hydrolase family 3 protein [Solirubrobacteraceae bacterium]
MRHGTLALLVGLLLAAAPASAAPRCPWMNPKLSANQRARELVSAMTIDQKIAMLSQAQPVWAHYGAAGFVPGQSSLCIPDLVLNDAGQGVGDLETNTTAFPAPIAQSSSWDPSLQWRFGAALGWQAWHKGINVQLAPGVEIDRVPLNGRNFEYMSEDPYLAAQGAVAEVRGIQSNPVIATVKHYVANSQETNRMTVSSDADQRTLEEIYTAPYEAAVKQGHAGSVMCSYNRINGTYACENRDTLTTILKRQFGFNGFVMSDWGGTHSTVAAANAGLDMEMDLKPGQYFTAPLKTAVQGRPGSDVAPGRHGHADRPHDVRRRDLRPPGRCRASRRSRQRAAPAGHRAGAEHLRGRNRAAQEPRTAASAHRLREANRGHRTRRRSDRRAAVLQRRRQRAHP